MGKAWHSESNRSCVLGVCVPCCMHSPSSPILLCRTRSQALHLSLGFGHWGAPWLEGKERKEVRVFVPCEICCAPHRKVTIPSLTAPALNKSVLTSLPLFLVPGDNDGCVDTSLELLLHTCHAFVTSPFLNKRTSP